MQENTDIQAHLQQQRQHLETPSSNPGNRRPLIGEIAASGYSKVHQLGEAVTQKCSAVLKLRTFQTIRALWPGRKTPENILKR